MKSIIKRPLIVWLSQLVFLLDAIVYLFTGLTTILMLIRREPVPVSLVVRLAVLVVGFEVLLLVPFWGLLKRKMYGRWLGVFSLIAIWGHITYLQLRPSLKMSAYYAAEHSVAVFIGQLLINLAFLFMPLRLATAKKVTTFLQPDSNVS
jgi:hypothetical protein